ncbi:FAD-dependent monooxygenase [Streptomyces sp. NPDC048603]|uniref:FAD-dependent monooxygenase n=1 Tax=Streptomyces sp. NPDC048603 TaxID=3365577 RepID=UPI003712838C
MTDTSTEVLVVGAGPTGLALGCELARRGITVRVVDGRDEPHRESRGKTLNAGGLAVLEQAGVADRIRGIGNPGLLFRKYFDGEQIEDSTVPGILFIGQWQIEEVLRRRLADLGGQVEYGARVAGIAQDGQGVTATLADGRRVHSEWLAGCDGGGSTVRRLLGIPFEGYTDEEQSMVVGDVRAPGLSRTFWHQWYTSDGAAMMLCPIPGTEVFQLQSSPERDAEGRALPPSAEGFRRLFDRHARMPGIRPADASWMSTWRVNVRMAGRLREGRAFLAGDAAHVHPIAGGLGMNTGLQDAAALARALSGETAPETYESERLAAAAHVLSDSTERMRRVLAATRTPGTGTEAGLG